MTDDAHREAEETLRSYAERRRREFGAPGPMPSHVRERLHAEVARQFAGPPSRGRGAALRAWLGMWWRPVVVGTAVVVIGLGIVGWRWHLVSPEKRQTLAKLEPPSAVQTEGRESPAAVAERLGRSPAPESTPRSVPLAGIPPTSTGALSLADAGPIQPTEARTETRDLGKSTSSAIVKLSDRDAFAPGTARSPGAVDELSNAPRPTQARPSTLATERGRTTQQRQPGVAAGERELALATAPPRPETLSETLAPPRLAASTATGGPAVAVPAQVAIGQDFDRRTAADAAGAESARSAFAFVQTQPGPAGAAEPRESGAILQQRFTQVIPAGKAPALNSFRLERVSNSLQIVDADGSVYRALLREPGGVADSPAAGRTPAIAPTTQAARTPAAGPGRGGEAPRNQFVSLGLSAEGTNVRLRQIVNFAGNLVVTNAAPLPLEPRQVLTNDAALRFLLSNSLIEGHVTLGTTNQYPILAHPTGP